MLNIKHRLRSLLEIKPFNWSTSSLVKLISLIIYKSESMTNFVKLILLSYFSLLTNIRYSITGVTSIFAINYFKTSWTFTRIKYAFQIIKILNIRRPDWFEISMTSIWIVTTRKLFYLKPSCIFLSITNFCCINVV